MDLARLRARSRGSFLLFAFLVGLLVVIGRVQGAEWSKMKKCEDLGFCRRHRARVILPETAFSVVEESVALCERSGVHMLCGRLRRGQSGEAPVLFGISALPDGMYRLNIDDADPTLHKRYVVKDVITDEMQGLKLAENHVTFHDGQAELAALGVNHPYVVVTYNPFRVDLVVGRESPVRIVSFNSESLFRFETHRPRPTPAPTQPDPPTTTASVVTVEDRAPLESPVAAEDIVPPLEIGHTEAPQEREAEQHAEEGDEMYDDHFGDHTDEYQGNAVQSASPHAEISLKNIEDDGLWEETFQSHHDPKVRGPESIGADVSFPFAEHVYGIPERTSRFSLEHTVRSDGSIVSEPYRLYNLDVFEFELHKPLGLYGAVPLLIGRNGGRSAAVLWLNAGETFVDVFERRSTGGRASHWFSETGIVDLFLIPGPTAADVMRQYLKLTGAPAMPQRFALGYHQCRWNYRDEADTRLVDAEFDRHEIPYDVMWLDIEHTDGKRYFTWDLQKFPDPSRLQYDLAARGRKMVTIIDPHIKRDNKYLVHKTAEDNHYYVKTPEGKSFEGWCWPGSSSYYDFTCPTAREAWAARFNSKDYPHFTEHLYTWVDMNEPSVFNGPEGTMPKHMIHVGAVEHRDVHNQYGYYVQKSTYSGLLQSRNGKDRPFVLSRSFFAGSQRYGAVWTGDNTAAWEHLETSARMLLPLQITGIVFSGADVGGFFGNPSPELLVRWYQAGAFQPFFRGHAHLDTNRREPWLFGEENTARISAAIRVRYTYLPLWYTVMAACALGDKIDFRVTGSGPPMRPVWWEFPDDKRLDDMDDQWMVGPGILAAPILKEGALDRMVYLPGTEPWYDLFAATGFGTPIEGGADLAVSAPLDRMIVFQRGGSIIPKQERRRRSTQAMSTDPYTLVVALDSRAMASGELFMDDGSSYNYLNGAHVLRRFIYSDYTLTASSVSGSGTGFTGEDAAVERILILGHLGPPPTHAIVRQTPSDGPGTRVDVTVDSASGVVFVRQPNVCAGKGEWSVRLATP
jgi:mannosyl-oligosaccharide alpha-1,3-glucosidase